MNYVITNTFYTKQTGYFGIVSNTVALFVSTIIESEILSFAALNLVLADPNTVGKSDLRGGH